jgi:hypothetical protein
MGHLGRYAGGAGRQPTVEVNWSAVQRQSCTFVNNVRDQVPNGIDPQ